MEKERIQTKKSALRIEYMKLSDLKVFPKNPKDHDIGQLHTSMDRFGFAAPIILDEKTGYMVAGHGRAETLLQKRAAGDPPPGNIQVADGEWLVPVVRGLSFKNHKEAKAYLLSDNRLTEVGAWDTGALVDMLKEMVDEPDSLMGTGFDLEEFQKLSDMATTLSDFYDASKTATPMHKRFKPSKSTVIGIGAFIYSVTGELGAIEVQQLTVKFNETASKAEKEAMAEDFCRYMYDKLREWVKHKEAANEPNCNPH